MNDGGEHSDTSEVEPATFVRVREILDAGTGDGDPGHSGVGRFWDLPLEEFLTTSVYDNPIIAPAGSDRGKNSNLVRILRGEDVDTGPMPRMPMDRDPISDEDIAYIERWIDEGCNA